MIQVWHSKMCFHRVTKTGDENLNLRAASTSHNSKAHLAIFYFRYLMIDNFNVNMQVRIKTFACIFCM